MKNNKIKSKLNGLKKNIALTVSSAFYMLRLTYTMSPAFVWLHLASAVLGTISPILNSVLTKYLLDELTVSPSPRRLVLIVAAIVLSSAVLAVVLRLIGRWIAVRSIEINNRFNLLIHEKTAQMDFSFTENKEILDRREYALNGLTRIGGVSAYINCLSQMIRSIVTLFTITAIFININIIVPTIILLVRISGFYFNNKKEKKEYEFQNLNAELNDIFSYTYFLSHNETAAKDSRIYDLKPLYRKKMQIFRDRSFDILRRSSLSDFFYTALLSLMTHIYLIIAYAFYIIQYFRDPDLFTIGSLSMAISLATQFDSSTQAIIDGIIRLFYNGKYIQQYRLFMDTEDVMDKSGTMSLPAGGAYTFEFVNVSFKYPQSDQYTLENISCIIPSGKKTALVGENGSGKSTFIKLLCRLYDPTEGKILLNGIDIKEYAYEDYLNAFSVVSQDYDILPFSIRENINLSTTPEKEDTKVWDTLRQVGLKKQIEKADLQDATYINSKFSPQGINFSGGEKQKIAIARALYKNAPVMILDEPTSALDPRSEYDIYKMYHHNINDKTAILISHRLSSCHICDYILVFKSGKIVQTGDHDTLVNAEGLYCDLWNAQAAYYTDKQE